MARELFTSRVGARDSGVGELATVLRYEPVRGFCCDHDEGVSLGFEVPGWHGLCPCENGICQVLQSTGRASGTPILSFDKALVESERKLAVVGGLAAL